MLHERESSSAHHPRCHPVQRLFAPHASWARRDAEQLLDPSCYHVTEAKVRVPMALDESPRTVVARRSHLLAAHRAAENERTLVAPYDDDVLPHVLLPVEVLDLSDGEVVLVPGRGADDASHRVLQHDHARRVAGGVDVGGCLPPCRAE